MRKQDFVWQRRSGEVGRHWEAARLWWVILFCITVILSNSLVYGKFSKGYARPRSDCIGWYPTLYSKLVSDSFILTLALQAASFKILRLWSCSGWSAPATKYIEKTQVVSESKIIINRVNRATKTTRVKQEENKKRINYNQTKRIVPWRDIF